jgi:hypothetical protein
MNNYFEDNELMCKCGCEELTFDADFKNTLNHVRHLYGKPIYITSGYRCHKHNKAVGGKDNSAHTKGLAVDMKCENSKDRYELIGIFYRLGIERIGVSGKFLHIDKDTTKPSPVIWTY